jgi:hypothetical protein|tara:strand:+ start:3617 stop:4294 length:678 start_codon:yes stop_codon:yes gene_type:complete
MVLIKNLIISMKADSFDDALSNALPIFDSKKNEIGKLIPIGNWILTHTKKIENLSVWRQKNMKFFFSQFNSSCKRTLWYIKNLSIEKNNRIFFLIYTNNHKLIGHIGLAEIEKNFATMDNMVRGEEGGDPKLMYYSMIAIINWSFKILNIENLYGRIISYNWLTIFLYEEISFKIIERIPLKKIEENGEINHKDVDSSESNVRYFCTKVLLKKKDFYKNINWITK